jgi:hypothetical protein
MFLIWNGRSEVFEMPISYSITEAPIMKLSDTDRAFLGLTSDDIMKVGIEFMSFMNQRPNAPDGCSFTLTEKEQAMFARHLDRKGWKWAYIVPAMLLGAVWSREV